MDVFLLGNKIASELGADKARDTTAQWMAHYLAELLTASESDASLRPQCATLILQLWEKRSVLPKGDPLGRYDGLIGPLRKLFRLEQRWDIPERPRKPNDPASTWLDIAKRLDHASSAIIAYALRKAIGYIEQPNEELLKLATLVEPDAQTNFVELVLVLGLLNENDSEIDDTVDMNADERFNKKSGELNKVLHDIETENDRV